MKQTTPYTATESTGSITVFLDQDMQTQSPYTVNKSLHGCKFKGQSLAGLDNKITNKTVRCYGK